MRKESFDKGDFVADRVFELEDAVISDGQAVCLKTADQLFIGLNGAEFGGPLTIGCLDVAKIYVFMVRADKDNSFGGWGDLT